MTLVRQFLHRLQDNSTVLKIDSCGKIVDKSNFMEEFQLSTGTCAIISNCTKEITININVDFRVYVVDPVVGKISLMIQTGDKIYAKGEFTSR